MKLIDYEALNGEDFSGFSDVDCEEFNGDLWLKVMDVYDIVKRERIENDPENLRYTVEALTERAEKAEEQCESLLSQLDDLRDIKDEIMTERDTYKAIIRTVEALTGKEILREKREEVKWLA